MREAECGEPRASKRDIRQYFESQVDDEEITHLEKIASERILGRKHDVWDLHTDKERWWIITDATNLYRQRDFPSMDYAISFHIGLMVRIVARQRASVTEEEQTRFSVAWRRFEQSHQALDKAEEAEDFQAVGMRCRECLIAFVREAGTDDMVPDDQMRPKRSDFIHWSELIAQKVAAGDSNERLRNYLKTTAKVTWEYVQTLTHASNAARFDDEIAIDATGHVLSAYSHALLRQEQHPPNRCPDCSSYRLFREYVLEIDSYVTICEVCGWEDEPEPEPPKDEQVTAAIEREASRRASQQRSGEGIGHTLPDKFRPY
jgi:hypothetical protein